jgi:ribonuclease J
MAERQLQVIPLGGLGEFGMNCMALRYGDDIIVIDCGMMFPEAEMMGVDIVIPDFTFLEENKEHVRALFLTHGHEDHIGAMPFFVEEFPVPIYGTAFTLGLVERRLDEHDLLKKARLNTVKPRTIIEAGPFKVEFIQVTHSIVQATALAITTPVGVVIHTGDYKVDQTPIDNEAFDLHTLAEYGKRGVLLLLSDSTGADTAGFTPSERAVRPRLDAIFSHAEHRGIVTCF